MIWKEQTTQKKVKDLKNMVLGQKWKQRVEENFLKEEGIEEEKTSQYLQLSKKRENKNKLMKSKILALSKNEEFKNLLKKRKVSNKYVTIFFGNLDNKSNKNLNISFVAKKKLGNAVKRNKIKRRLKQIVNEAVKKISVKFNFSYLVIAKPTMLSKDYTNIKETLFQDLEKIR